MTLRTILRRMFGRRKLHCWPGAVAVVVDDGSYAGKYLRGKTVTCSALVKNERGEPAWQYEGKQLLIVLSLFQAVPVEFIPDSILRPITPPPGTVSDEEVSELYESRELCYIESSQQTADDRAYRSLGGC